MTTPLHRPRMGEGAILSLVCALALLPAGPAGGAGGDAARGEAAWTASHRPPGAPGPRSCASCHTADLTRAGKHATTGKPIEPMAVSVSPGRLADPAKVEKWLGRNCRWTLGRECTTGEKADFLAYIRSR